jgi:chromatin segregation and condensation protein Rec8/ScpA/Scc1 (kleisin family)
VGPVRGLLALDARDALAQADGDRPDDRPLRFYVEQLVRTVKARRSMSLRELIDDIGPTGGAAKATMIGTFCALLELVKLGVVHRAPGSERRPTS